MHNFDPSKLYDIYSVTVRARNRICGGMPKNKDLLRGWIAATTEHDDATTDGQVADARAALLEPTEEKSWNGFRGDPELGLYVECRQLKALFKEAATMLRMTTDKRGSKQIFQHGFEVKAPDGSDRIYLGTKEPTAFAEGPIHVQTAQGPRTAIKRVDYVERAELSFEVWVLSTHASETRHIGEADVVEMLRFGQENGFGADRSQGHGKFDVTAFAVRQKSAKRTEEPEAKAAKAKKDKPVNGAVPVAS
jgi:hypothetical protein